MSSEIIMLIRRLLRSKKRLRLSWASTKVRYRLFWSRCTQVDWFPKENSLKYSWEVDSKYKRMYWSTLLEKLQSNQKLSIVSTIASYFELKNYSNLKGLIKSLDYSKCFNKLYFILMLSTNKIALFNSVCIGKFYVFFLYLNL